MKIYGVLAECAERAGNDDLIEFKLLSCLYAMHNISVFLTVFTTFLSVLKAQFLRLRKNCKLQQSNFFTDIKYSLFFFTAAK